MGFDAFVYCNCLQEGKTRPPPVPVEWSERFITPVNAEANSWTESDDLVFEWKKTACEHPNMHYADEWIASWFSYHRFKNALEYVGWNFFPYLQTELPESNDGSTSAVIAEKCLQELQVFTEIAKFDAIYLIDSDNGNVISDNITPFKVVWIFDPNFDYGLDAEGFFVRNRVDGIYQFRSRRFEQRSRSDGEGKVEYYDVQTEQRFVSDVILHATTLQTNPHFPTLLHVENRKVGAEYFDFILKPLRKVFEASVETGNPVYWS